MAMETSYSFVMEPPGHWHVFWRKTVRFTVTKSATGQPASARNLVVSVTREGDAHVTTLSATDEGDGVYSVEFTPLALTPHAFSVAFQEDGHAHTSQPWPVEIARDGEEGVRAEAQGSVYVYQIRYDWSAGPIHANDAEAVTLTFELMRGHQEGDAIKWEQPWLNSFDHVTDAREAEVSVESEDGSVRETIPAEYRGMGVYAAERVFSTAEAGAGRSYGVRFRFTDPYNGARVTHEKAYGLEVVGTDA